MSKSSDTKLHPRPRCPADFFFIFIVLSSLLDMEMSVIDATTELPGLRDELPAPDRHSHASRWKKQGPLRRRAQAELPRQADYLRRKGHLVLS